MRTSYGLVLGLPWTGTKRKSPFFKGLLRNRFFLDNRLLEELGEIRETLVIYPRRQGQRQNQTATCLTRMNPLQQRLFSLLDLQRYASISR